MVTPLWFFAGLKLGIFTEVLVLWQVFGVAGCVIGGYSLLVMWAINATWWNGVFDAGEEGDFEDGNGGPLPWSDIHSFDLPA